MMSERTSHETKGNKMTSQTKAVQTIIRNIARSLEAACVSHPEVMMQNILDDAQELVNENGYTWDVALAIACKAYPCTQYSGEYAYAA